MPPKEQQIVIKIEKIKKYLKDIAYYKQYSFKEIKSNIRLLAALERFLYLACDSTISLLEMVISYKGFGKATSYSENADILFENKLIETEELNYLHKLIGLRNVLSHDYDKLNIRILKEIVDNEIVKLSDILNKLEQQIE